MSYFNSIPSHLLKEFPSLRVISPKGNISSGLITINPGTIGANGLYTTTVTISGIAVGDILIPQIETGAGGPVRFEGMYPSAANTATVMFSNSDAATARARGATNIRYLWIDLTA